MKKINDRRRAPWIGLTVPIVILTFVIVGLFLVFIPNANSTKSTSGNISNEVEVPISTVTDAIDSNYPGIKIVTEISNDKNAPFSLQYPQSIHNSFNEEIKTFIKEIRDNYLTEIADAKQFGAQFSGELNISFETFPHHSEIYSFVLVNSTNIGGANGSTEIVSFRLNPETGKQITIEDVFDHDLEKILDVSTAVREKLFNDEKIQDHLFEEEVKFHTEPRWDNYRNFALTNDAIIFYFNENQIDDGAAGVPIVSIPLESINNLVASDFKQETRSEAEVESDVTENNTPPLDEDSNVDENEAIEVVEVPPMKLVALTFDDGPDPKVTTQILATLKKYDAKATFFMLGSRVEYYPEIAINVDEAGHELGNHTWNHLKLTQTSIKKVNMEIARTSSIIEDVTGNKATLFRPPYGAVNDTVYAQSTLPVILWDVDTLDWKHRNANQILSYVKKGTKDGSIILMHDIHQSTADGLDAVLSYLVAEGYSFVTVSDLN